MCRQRQPFRNIIDGFDVDSGVGLKIDAFTDKQPGYATEIGSDREHLDRMPYRAEEILVARGTCQIAKRCVEVAVGCSQAQRVDRTTFQGNFDPLVAESSGVLIEHIESLDHIGATGVIGGQIGCQIARELMSGR